MGGPTIRVLSSGPWMATSSSLSWPASLHPVNPFPNGLAPSHHLSKLKSVPSLLLWTLPIAPSEAPHNLPQQGLLGFWEPCCAPGL